MSSPPAAIEHPPETDRRRFGAELRGVQWRIDLGILPQLPRSSSVDDLRRVTANSRRSYATLRRQLLVDPHISKNGSNFPGHVMDNPLSQNPDSKWGRFFQKAELEKMVDQDLSRLYPEHGSYFQTSGCQCMLRRILLLWCIRHPNCGYRQGMHELLAPLLYVLQVDIERLSGVRKLYEEYFTDNFDGFSFHEKDLTYKFDFKKNSDSEDIDPHKNPSKASGLEELDPKIQDIVLFSDAYGAEGELGIVISEKFMEHDAYCMFDALMNGSGGALAMADFFASSPVSVPQTGLPPVIEASSALYHVLSIIDSSLYSHLVELGVEPQYFALRWLRVLFGREFALEDLLIVWDETFAFENTNFNRSSENDDGFSFGILKSSRGAFISALAVSMILCLRSSLLATENATSCLQRLLNLPEINIQKLIAKAKSLVPLAMDANKSTPPPVHVDRNKLVVSRGPSVSLDSNSPGSPLSVVSDSYWEEKWRVLHKEGESKRGALQKQVKSQLKGWSDRVKVRLTRTESGPSPSKPDLSARKNLLEDLSRELGSEEDVKKIRFDENMIQKNQSEESQDNDSGNCLSEDSSSIFSDPLSPGVVNGHENDSERSSVASNLSTDDNQNELKRANIQSSRTDERESSPLPVSDAPEDLSFKSGQIEDSSGKPGAILKERKLLSGKFHWFWKFGRNNGEATKTSLVGCSQNNAVGCSSADFDNRDHVDQNTMVNLKNLGQSMLENIQVIESALLQDNKGQAENTSKDAMVGSRQFAAMEAIEELRKISNLITET